MWRLYKWIRMNELKSSTELKANAREYLLGNYGRVVPAQIMYLLFIYLIDGLNGGALTTGNGSYLRSFLTLALAFIASILREILNFGLCCFYMNLCCGFPTRINDLFRGFRFSDDRPARIALMLTLRLVLYLCPGFAIYALYTVSRSFFLLPLASLALVAGLLFYYIYYLNMSQCYYLILDFPEKNISEIIQLSRWLMNGRKMRLFYLQVGFIPILLLAAVPCGVGLLWAQPYMYTTFACFHLHLTAKAAAQG